jgi:hypothetical protein
LRALLRISTGGFSRRNLYYVRRCRIGILIVRIIIIGWYRYRVIRPPEWTIYTSYNYPAHKKAERRTIGSISSVIISVIASVIPSGIIMVPIIVSRNPASTRHTGAADTGAASVYSGARVPRAG